MVSQLAKTGAVLGAVLALSAVAPPAFASASSTRSGFLVSPVKSPGPIPITIDNLSSREHTYDLAEVRTRMYSRDTCGPTSLPSNALQIPAKVTVGAHKTVRVPVRVTSTPATLTDVAVKVTQAGAAKDGQVGVSAAVYAQEILGRGTASGCAVIRGAYAQRKPTASAPAHSSTSLPMLVILVAIVVALLLAGLAFAAGRRGRRRPAAHRHAA